MHNLSAVYIQRMLNVFKQYVGIRCNFLRMHKILDLLAECQRIPPYNSVFVSCLKRISNVLSVYKRTCCMFHTSAYAGAIRRSVTGPLVMHKIH